MGGFVTGPGGVAAWLSARPLLIHEQNAVAGLTNRCSRAREPACWRRFRAASAGARARAYRQSRCAARSPRCRRPNSASPGAAARCGCWSLGGSQGASAAERGRAAGARAAAAHRSVGSAPPGRRAHCIAARAAYARAGVDARGRAFIDDMAEAYAWADLVVCRAGALTVAELAAAGVAARAGAVPHAVDDHQTRNARFLVDAGARVLMPSRSSRRAARRRAARLRRADRDRCCRWPTRARALARPEADARLADAMHARGQAAGGARMSARATIACGRIRTHPLRRHRRRGMGGIAEVLLNLGYEVQGSDLKPNASPRGSESLGARVITGHDAAQRRAARRRGRLDGGATDNPEVARRSSAHAGGAARGDARRADALPLRRSPWPARTARPRPPAWSPACSPRAARIPTFVIGGLLKSAGTNARLGAGATWSPRRTRATRRSCTCSR
jgi:UDP-N-acetylglucosamine--N-acetylmuramyl-(pentapeptide) pyrophosphoryl-undecaprenol N-acetylglucosamine transferase